MQNVPASHVHILKYVGWQFCINISSFCLTICIKQFGHHPIPLFQTEVMDVVRFCAMKTCGGIKVQIYTFLNLVLDTMSL